MRDSKEFVLVDKLFPRIGLFIETYWGSAKGYSYLNDLLFDTRDGDRVGFSKEVAAAIAKLQLLHREQFPQYVLDNHDAWSNSPG